MILDGISRIQTFMKVVDWARTVRWPDHVLAIVGGVFVIVGVVQHFALKIKAAKQPVKPEADPKPPEPPAYLKVEGCIIRVCSFQEPNKLLPGTTHRAAKIDFLNDPQSPTRGYARSVFAKITYFDSDGKAYLNVERGMWNDGSCGVYLGIGDSKRLVLAIMRADGNAFTIDHEAGPNPYAEHYEVVYSPFQVPLRSGAGKVSVRLSYSYEPEHWFGAIPAPQGQLLWFTLTVGKLLQLKPE